MTTTTNAASCSPHGNLSQLVDLHRKHDGRSIGVIVAAVGASVIWGAAGDRKTSLFAAGLVFLILVTIYVRNYYYYTRWRDTQRSSRRPYYLNRRIGAFHVPTLAAAVVCASSLLFAGSTTATTLPTTTTTAVATGANLTTSNHTVNITTTNSYSNTTTITQLKHSSPPETSRVVWNAKRKLVDAPTTAADNGVAWGLREGVNYYTAGFAVAEARQLGADVTVAQNFSDVQTQLNACSRSGASCYINIANNISWTSELTVEPGQDVTITGVVVGGGRPWLEAFNTSLIMDYKVFKDFGGRRHLNVSEGGTLSLENLGFKNGYMYCSFAFFNGACSKEIIRLSGGGAIHNTGTIPRIDQCHFDNNIQLTMGGGAIYNSGTISRIDQCHFNNSRAINSVGGAIYNDGTISKIDQCHFDNNRADDNVIIISSNPQYLLHVGGAIFNAGTISRIDQCRFKDNRANYGGAINHKGLQPIVLSSATFEKNVAIRAGLKQIEGAGRCCGSIHGITPAQLWKYFKPRTKKGKSHDVYVYRTSTLRLAGPYTTDRANLTGSIYLDGVARIYKGCAAPGKWQNDQRAREELGSFDA